MSTQTPTTRQVFVDPATGVLTPWGHRFLLDLVNDVRLSLLEANQTFTLDATADLSNRIDQVENQLGDLQIEVSGVAQDAKVENLIPQMRNFNMVVRGLGVEEYLFTSPGATVNAFNAGTFADPSSPDPGFPGGEFADLR